MSEAERRSVAESPGFTPGALGNAHSHKRLWERSASLGRPIFVFEDDAVLRKDLVRVFSDVVRRLSTMWDIIVMGFNTNSLLVLQHGQSMPPFALPAYPGTEDLERFRHESQEVLPGLLAYQYGIPGYAITPRGAVALLDCCFPMTVGNISVVPGRNPHYVGGGTLGSGTVRLGVYTIDGVMNRFYAKLAAYACVPPLVLPHNDPSTSTTLPSGSADRSPARRRPRA